MRLLSHLPMRPLRISESSRMGCHWFPARVRSTQGRNQCVPRPTPNPLQRHPPPPPISEPRTSVRSVLPLLLHLAPTNPHHPTTHPPPPPAAPNRPCVNLRPRHSAPTRAPHTRFAIPRAVPATAPPRELNRRLPLHLPFATCDLPFPARRARCRARIHSRCPLLERTCHPSTPTSLPRRAVPIALDFRLLSALFRVHPRPPRSMPFFFAIFATFAFNAFPLRARRVLRGSSRPIPLTHVNPAIVSRGFDSSTASPGRTPCPTSPTCSAA